MEMKSAQASKVKHSIRRGDTVMVIAGGNKKKRVLKGQTGKIVRFVGENKERAIVEGLNMMTHHVRAAGPNKPSGKLQREGSIHVSNLMYFVEKLKRPVRLKHKLLADGKKVRGYLDPKSKEFVQITEGAK